jgi:hypothetical protein
MNKRSILAGLGIAAVALWVLGLVVGTGLPTNLADDATDAQVLAWVHGNTNEILLGGWLFSVGCIVFVWFAAQLRDRLAPSMATTVAYSASVMMAVFGVLTQGDLVSGIDKNDISPATAGVMHHAGDLAFVGVELSFMLFLGAIAVLAFRTAAVPRWWGGVCALIAVVALIGPIGWLAVIFGVPLFVLVTPWLLGRGSRGRESAAVTATA